MQIRGFKRRNCLTVLAQDEEFGKVERLLTELSGNLEDIDTKKAFTYGVKMGTGSESDPLIISLTSKHLLGNIHK